MEAEHAWKGWTMGLLKKLIDWIVWMILVLPGPDENEGEAVEEWGDVDDEDDEPEEEPRKMPQGKKKASRGNSGTTTKHKGKKGSSSHSDGGGSGEGGGEKGPVFLGPVGNEPDPSVQGSGSENSIQPFIGPLHAGSKPMAAMSYDERQAIFDAQDAMAEAEAKQVLALKIDEEKKRVARETFDAMRRAAALSANSAREAYRKQQEAMRKRALEDHAAKVRAHKRRSKSGRQVRVRGHKRHKGGKK